ncbi:PRC-barrel domain-containing protein [Hyphomonas pacifica]|uniref:PRC-barrel domain-containing protein n=1 Tax=Hyphomonas pacifica TaxID=1280941 RepID=A0A062U3C0_9PROT|nr:PRC-barrel domain-containing protein [Hyphomonas pacifica]KCZ52792.1 hypothetical protein HY2_07615 [Hyphomonas pacifica]RAN33078.1 hypothetical protein HY3_13590 [Hyphomonas pacifica]RAN33721.1 hypothetical protein HY11_03250 [Hyphomonas pacifica]
MSDTRITNPLISCHRVEGTEVYNADGDRLGHIDSIMLDKRKGNVAYAVMSFGGFLGIGEEYHPLPWNALTYNDNLDAYVIRLSKEQLNAAPRLKRNEYERLQDHIYGKSVYAYYGAAPYWY